jgi:hypothetical protein
MTSAHSSPDLNGTAHVIPFSALKETLAPKFPAEALYRSLEEYEVVAAPWHYLHAL